MSAVLRLRFALIRKFSVSRDNAPPFNHDFAATGVPGPKAAASGPGAGRTWVQGSRSVGSGLGSPPLAHKCTYAPLGKCLQGRRGEGGRPLLRRRQADVKEPKATAHLPEPNGPARLARKGTCTSRSHFGNQRRCSRRASKPSDQPRAWTTFRT